MRQKKKIIIIIDFNGSLKQLRIKNIVICSTSSDSIVVVFVYLPSQMTTKIELNIQ